MLTLRGWFAERHWMCIGNSKFIGNFKGHSILCNNSRTHFQRLEFHIQVHGVAEKQCLFCPEGWIKVTFFWNFSWNFKFYSVETLCLYFDKLALCLSLGIEGICIKFSTTVLYWNICLVSTSVLFDFRGDYLQSLPKVTCTVSFADWVVSSFPLKTLLIWWKLTGTRKRGVRLMHYVIGVPRTFGGDCSGFVLKFSKTHYKRGRR